jgi:hypothetical protein
MRRHARADLEGRISPVLAGHAQAEDSEGATDPFLANFNLERITRGEGSDTLRCACNE